MNKEDEKNPVFRIVVAASVTVLALAVAVGSVSAFYSGRIVAGVSVGAVPVGNLTPEQAALRLQERLDMLYRDGVAVQVDSAYEAVLPDSVGFDLNIQQAVDVAMERGHSGPRWKQISQRVAALWSRHEVRAPVSLDETLLTDRIEELGQLSDVARRDLRLSFQGHRVTLLTDTHPGKTINRQDSRELLAERFVRLSSGPVAVPLVDDIPRASLESARQAQASAQRVLARPLHLKFEDSLFTVTADVLGSWIENEYEGDRLLVGINERELGAYVTRIAERLNIPPEPAQVTTEQGRVTGFIPPNYGRAIQEGQLVQLIRDEIDSRARGDRTNGTVSIPVGRARPPSVNFGEGMGISELIGTATTPFTGSPKNRISNIKNGVRFLSGQVVEPGAEFSTLGALGTIDNTTGYLPELVIKGDRTIPEFGGGLCQVSTTLFRAALDAGLPITARRNHSFRVGYYEKDGSGRYIGPGLDATIYEPDLDMRFRNDTPGAVLIIGYVVGDKLTFELYGTRDGRTSEIIGPTTLTEVPAGDPVYVETATLPEGETRQVEWPHPGGSATATYRVTYPDGHTEEQEFKSWYRRWPAQFLVGTGGPAGEPAPTPFPVTPPIQ